MSGWKVRGARKDGAIEEIFITADTQTNAASEARARGLTPLSIQKGVQKPKKKIRGADKAATRLARELSALLGAGLTVEKALQSLSRFGGKSLTGRIAQDLLLEVRSGKPFSQALTEFPETFTPPFPQIAEAGEASGSLPEALADLANWREQKQKFESEMQGSLLYPVILLVFSTLAVIGILLFVVPRFEQIFDNMNAAPPAFAGFVFAVSAALSTWLPILGIGIFLCVFAFIIWYRRPRSKFMLYRISHQVPGLGKMLQAILAARFCRVLAVLLQNGLSAAPAFRLASAGLSDTYAREQLQGALEQVRRGSSLPDQIEQSGVLPPLAVEILRVGEETGDLAPAAKRLADLYEGRLERGIKMVIRLAEPLLIGFVGLVIGAIVLSILLALVSINEIEF